MAIVSIRTRKRLFEIAGAGLLCVASFLLQTLILNRFHAGGIICSLPLTITIVWGLVFGSPLPPITNFELRKKTAGQIFARQLAAGSAGGLLIGLFFAAMYSSIVPHYPVAFPIIGWVSGYLCLKSLNQGNLLCIPLTFALTIAGEAIMSWELFLLNRTGVFEHLAFLVFPEAMLNAIIAPLIYFPLRQWYETSEERSSSLTME